MRLTIKVDIKKSLGNFKLDVSFESDKKTIAILGASGSGKSMSLKCISGLVNPDEGYVEIDGFVYCDTKNGMWIPTKDRNVGFMFQNYALFPHMTALENIKFGIKGDDAHCEREARKLLKSFYIKELADRYPKQLSGGQKQRVAMARILATKPKVILLDEPFSALDGPLRWKMEEEIIGMIRDYGIPTILVSHDRNEVYRICDEVVILNRGKLEVFGDKQELFMHPKTLVNSILVGFENHSRIELSGNGAILATDFGLELPLTAEQIVGKSHMGIKAVNVTIGVRDGSEQEFTVKRVIPEVDGSIIILNKDPESGEYKDIRADIRAVDGFPKEGDRVKVKLDVNNIALLS